MRRIFLWRLGLTMLLLVSGCANPTLPTARPAVVEVTPASIGAPTSQISPSASAVACVWDDVHWWLEDAFAREFAWAPSDPWDWIGFFDTFERRLANTEDQGLIRLADYEGWPDADFIVLLRALDPDGDGWADARLLSHAVSRLVSAEAVWAPVDLIAGGYDTDGDGLVNQAEALAFFTALAGGSGAVEMAALLAQPWADQEGMLRLFYAYDPDGDHVIPLDALDRGVIGIVEVSDEELRCEEIPGLGEAQQAALCGEIASWDIDDDGMLDMGDFDLPLVHLEGAESFCPVGPVEAAGGASPCALFDSTTTGLLPLAALLQSGLRPTWTWIEAEASTGATALPLSTVVAQRVAWQGANPVQTSVEEELAALARALHGLRQEAQTYAARASGHREQELALEEKLGQRQGVLDISKKLWVYGDMLFLASGITAIATQAAHIAARSGLRVTLGLGKQATAKAVYAGATRFVGAKAQRDLALRALHLGTERGKRVFVAEFTRLLGRQSRRALAFEISKDITASGALAYTLLEGEDEVARSLMRDLTIERGERIKYETLYEHTLTEWRATREELRQKLSRYPLTSEIVTGLWRIAPNSFLGHGQVHLWQVGDRVEGMFEYTYDRVLVGTVWLNKKKSGRIEGRMARDGTQVVLTLRWWEGSKGYSDAKPATRGEARWERVTGQPDLLRGHWKRDGDTDWQGGWDLRRER